VWRDICATNADAIAAALDCLIQRLTQLRGDLQRGDAVDAIFSAAANAAASRSRALISSPPARGSSRPTAANRATRSSASRAS
jgi:hypothetical protein